MKIVRLYKQKNEITSGSLHAHRLLEQSSQPPRNSRKKFILTIRRRNGGGEGLDPRAAKVLHRALQKLEGRTVERESAILTSRLFNRFLQPFPISPPSLSHTFFLSTLQSLTLSLLPYFPFLPLSNIFPLPSLSSLTLPFLTLPFTPPPTPPFTFLARLV